jgi:hypothetical protein
MLADRIAHSLGSSGRRAERERGQHLIFSSEKVSACRLRRSEATWRVGSGLAVVLLAPASSTSPRCLQTAPLIDVQTLLQDKLLIAGLPRVRGLFLQQRTEHAQLGAQEPICNGQPLR